jgi:small subunit ribosomal protein S6
MRHYEVTFIIDPVLSDDERKSIVQFYADYLRKEKCEIVHIDEMGLVPLAYTIAKRQSGYYVCIEWHCEDPSFLVKFELALRRDERILRFLTVALDKFGVKYNEDKRAGKIGKKKKDKAAKAKPADTAAAAVAEPKAEVAAAVTAEPEIEIPAELLPADLVEEDAELIVPEDPELLKILDKGDEV